MKETWKKTTKPLVVSRQEREQQAKEHGEKTESTIVIVKCVLVILF